MAKSSNTTNQPQISQYIRDKANRTRLSIESYYAQAMVQLNEREQRAEKLEQQMSNEGYFIPSCADCDLTILTIILLVIGIDEQEKEAKRKIHATEENNFLRQQRTRLSASDFQSLKVLFFNLYVGGINCIFTYSRLSGEEHLEKFV
jgi:hypothetical protein